MRSAKGGLQLSNFELRRIGDGVGPNFDEKLTADRFDPVMEGAQPELIVGQLMFGASYLDLKQSTAALGVHGMRTRSLIEGLSYEPVEAGFYGEGNLRWKACEVTGHGSTGFALMAAHRRGDGVRQR